MIVTPDFVMINFPKAGSTFSRTVITRVYENRERRLGNRILRKLGLRRWPIQHMDHFNPIRGYRDPHGRVEQIPAEHRHKPIVTLARDPVEKLLSSYNHYLKTPADQYMESMNIIARNVAADYPVVTFPDYYQFWKIWNAYWQSAQDLRIGPVTLEFLNFFSTDPDAAYRHLKENGDDIEGLLRHLPGDLTFLRTESLNRDIKAFLLRCGFGESDVAFIEDHPRILPDGIGRSKGDISREDLDPDFLARFLEEERIVYQLYEKFGASYPRDRRPASSSRASNGNAAGGGTKPMASQVSGTASK